MMTEYISGKSLLEEKLMIRQLRLTAICTCILLLGLFLSQNVADSQKRRGSRTVKTSSIVEVKPGANAVADAPPECAQLVRDFIAYTSRQKPDITNDTQARNRWLSDGLRKALDHRLSAYKDYAKKNPDSPEGPPANGDFMGSWDFPTTYSIVAARRYDNRAIVDVNFVWGPKTEYAGDTRLVSYVMVREGNAWKLDDIYTFQGKFVSAGSLSQTFQSDTYP